MSSSSTVSIVPPDFTSPRPSAELAHEENLLIPYFKGGSEDESDLPGAA